MDGPGLFVLQDLWRGGDGGIGLFEFFSCFIVFSKASSGVLLFFTLLLATFDQSSSLNRGCTGAYLGFLSVCPAPP